MKVSDLEKGVKVIEFFFSFFNSSNDFRRTNIKELAQSIKASEPVITDSVMDQLIETLEKLQSKVCDNGVKRYYKYKTLQTHLLPLTNIAFDKLGKRYKF